MGISIHYRGSLDDPGQLDEFEKWAILKSAELAAEVRLFRLWSNRFPDRCIKGLTIDLSPKIESLTLLVSPEGELISMDDVDVALTNRRDELKWCSIETQGDSADHHVSAVEILSKAKKRSSAISKFMMKRSLGNLEITNCYTRSINSSRRLLDASRMV